MKLIARCYCIIADPKKDLKSFEVDSLEKDLRDISEMTNKVAAMVQLFRLVSPMQDENELTGLIKKLENKNYGQLNEVIKALETIQLHIQRAGRDEFGMNRTKKGEVVNSKNVFLGGVYGLNTKPASFWLENREKLEKELYTGSDKSVWYFINQHASDFVDSHVNGLLPNLETVRSLS